MPLDLGHECLWVDGLFDIALAAGCTGYVEKPINPETFMDEVEQYL